ncbi:MAG: ABC transporter ATP-binding protein [Deferribacterales bacterium]|nr:ABC transporter ATP-binding protein [Deferribacterales bacterium]
MLKLDSVCSRYGNIYALKGVSLHVKAGEIVTIIGANGAGKSTTLNTISGIVRAVSGTVKFNGMDITSMPTEKIVESGLIQVPEGREIFPQLTVYENLMLGAYLRKDKSNIDKDLDYVVGLFPRLSERFKQLGGTLSGGEQQMLAIGRALMSKPKLLLMDEPSLGLSPIFVHNIFSVIKEINKEGTAVLLVEQNANMALSVASRGYVMETGKITMEDRADRLLNDESVKKAYLGI